MPVSVMVLLAMVLATAGLAGYRKFIAKGEDDYIHLGSGAIEAGVVSNQIHTAETLDRIDKAGKVLTLLTALYGLCVLSWFVYGEMVNRGAL